MSLSKATAFWPGLPQLWFRSQWTGLVYAIFFAVAINLALLSTFYWQDWYPSWLCRVLWVSIVSASGWSIVSTIPNWNALRNLSVSNANLESRFTDAQHYYLQGNYFEAEAVLVALLTRAPDDVDAMLLLSSILRRTKRHKQALQWLHRIELLDRGVKWTREIAEERAKLALLESNADPKSDRNA